MSCHEVLRVIVLNVMEVKTSSQSSVDAIEKQ